MDDLGILWLLSTRNNLDIWLSEEQGAEVWRRWRNREVTGPEKIGPAFPLDVWVYPGDSLIDFQDIAGGQVAIRREDIVLMNRTTADTRRANEAWKRALHKECCQDCAKPEWEK